MRYIESGYLPLFNHNGQISLQLKISEFLILKCDCGRMDELLGRRDRILPDKGRRNSKDYCPFAAEVPGHREYREQALRGMAIGDPVRDKNFPERTLLIDKKACLMNGWASRVVFLDELEVLIEGDTATVVSINLVEVPLHHFFRDLDLQWLEGVLHQPPELNNIN